MYVVTGGAGFIGSNLVGRLAAAGVPDLVVVDDLADGRKFRNIADLPVADYLDRVEFLERVEHDRSFVDGLQAILHQGACSTTTAFPSAGPRSCSPSPITTWPRSS